MPAKVNVNDMWHRHEDFAFAEAVEETYCEAAKAFAPWVDDLMERTTASGSAIAVNQAKVLLLDRYWAWYASLPQKHRNHIGQRSRHTCIFQVFSEGYMRLRALELSITPPRVIEQPPSLPTPRPSIVEVPALFIGELDD